MTEEVLVEIFAEHEEDQIIIEKILEMDHKNNLIKLKSFKNKLSNIEHFNDVPKNNDQSVTADISN